MLYKIALIAFFTFTLLSGIVNAQTPTTPAQTAPTDSAAAIVGKWTGTFEGASSGKFELVISQDVGRKLTGQVVMLTSDGSRYPITLKTIMYQNGQLSAGFTDSQNGEVRFMGKPDSTGLKGTWDANDGQDTGSWQVNRAGR